MKSGELLNCCSTSLRRDHLATIENATKTQDTNNKMWIASGFNGFGQLGTTKRKLPQFEEIKTPLQNANLPLVFACSWSYLAVASGRSLCLQGHVLNQINNIIFFQTESDIKSLAVCDRYCLVLQKDGRLYKILLSDTATMEEVRFQRNDVPLLPQKRSILSERKFRQKTYPRIDFVACGNNIMTAIGTLNEVFNGTIQTNHFPQHVRTQQLVCGFEHVLLLTTNGDIYAWGNGLRGQLGQEDLRIEEKPVIIDALSGIKICYIASSGWHCAAISVFNDLYAWGYNSSGQLGMRLYKNEIHQLKEPTTYSLPQIIEPPKCSCKDDCVPLKVACGARHTVLLMGCGSIFTFGNNAYGQLGIITSLESCDNFQHVHKVADVNSVEIVAGAWGTLIGI